MKLDIFLLSFPEKFLLSNFTFKSLLSNTFKFNYYYYYNIRFIRVIEIEFVSLTHLSNLLSMTR